MKISDCLGMGAIPFYFKRIFLLIKKKENLRGSKMKNFTTTVFVIVLSTMLLRILFSDTQRGIRIDYPKGSEVPVGSDPYHKGETFYVGEIVEIRWTNTGPVDDKVFINYKTRATEQYIPIECVQNTGRYSWRVPDLMTTTARIWVERRPQCNYPRSSANESGYFIISPLKVLGSTITMNPSEIQDGQPFSLEFDIQNLTIHSVRTVVRVIEPSTNVGTGEILGPDRDVTVNPGIQHFHLTDFCRGFKKPTGTFKGLSVKVLYSGGTLDFAHREFREIQTGVYKLAPWEIQSVRPVRRF